MGRFWSIWGRRWSNGRVLLCVLRRSEEKAGRRKWQRKLHGKTFLSRRLELWRSRKRSARYASKSYAGVVLMTPRPLRTGRVLYELSLTAQFPVSYYRVRQTSARQQKRGKLRTSRRVLWCKRCVRQRDSCNFFGWGCPALFKLVPDRCSHAVALLRRMHRWLQSMLDCVAWF